MQILVERGFTLVRSAWAGFVRHSVPKWVNIQWEGLVAWEWVRLGSPLGDTRFGV